jgi:5-methylcytosine-specific restriction endonuclease McrA
MGLSEKAMLRFRRAQDRVSESKGRPVSLEETLGVLLEEYLKRRDPVERAKRSAIRRGNLGREKSESPSPESSRSDARREPIPSSLRHSVNLRDGGKCAFTRDGRRCGSSRFTDIHHLVPVSRGGKNELGNLITLCRAHHRWVHEQERRRE